jgi:cytochrome c oxidase assembly factor CtaG
MLGALMTFSAAPWYAVYQGSVTPWHLTPLQDQQVAGLVMWIPGGFVYLVVGLYLVTRWLQAEARHGRGDAASSRGWPATAANTTPLASVSSPGRSDATA